MRKLLLIVAIATTFLMCLNAQKSDKTFDLGDHNKYTETPNSIAAENEMKLGNSSPMTVPLGIIKVGKVEKAWRKFMADYKGRATGETSKLKDGSFLTKNAIIAQIGGNCYLDVFAKFEQTDDSVTMNITFDVGKIQFTHDEYQSKYAGACTFTRLFQYEIRRIILKEQGDEQQIIFLKALKERKSVGKDIAHSMKTVEELKFKIDKMQMQVETEITDISTMKKRYKALDELIEQRKEVLAEINALMRENKPQ